MATIGTLCPIAPPCPAIDGYGPASPGAGTGRAGPEPRAREATIRLTTWPLPPAALEASARWSQQLGLWAIPLSEYWRRRPSRLGVSRLACSPCRPNRHWSTPSPARLGAGPGSGTYRVGWCSTSVPVVGPPAFPWCRRRACSSLSTRARTCSMFSPRQRRGSGWPTPRSSAAGPKSPTAPRGGRGRVPPRRVQRGRLAPFLAALDDHAERRVVSRVDGPSIPRAT